MMQGPGSGYEQPNRRAILETGAMGGAQGPAPRPVGTGGYVPETIQSWRAQNAMGTAQGPAPRPMGMGGYAPDYGVQGGMHGVPYEPRPQGLGGYAQENPYMSGAYQQQGHGPGQNSGIVPPHLQPQNWQDAYRAFIRSRLGF